MQATTLLVRDADFGNAYLRLVDQVGSRDGWVGLVHVAHELEVPDGDLMLWAWANADRLGLELRGEAARFATVRMDRNVLKDLARDVAAVALAFAVIGLLLAGAGVLA